MAFTIKEIAKLSGVSRGTVDRVIHQRQGVSPEIRERVQTILREVNYEPNTAAVALKRTDRNLSIGVIIPDRNNEFFLDVYDGIQGAARRCRGYGVKVEEYQMHESTGQELVQGINWLLERNVNALAFQGIDEPVVCRRLAQIPEDFPVVTFNNDLHCRQKICFVGQDSHAAGAVAGQMMQLYLRKKGEVAIFIGRSALTHQTERVQGFRKIIGTCENVETLLGPIETYEQETVAFERASDLLREHPHLVGIYAAGGGQKSIAAALAHSGRAADVVMIGHDLLPQTVSYLKQGVVNCTIGQEPYNQGFYPIEILSDYLLYHRKPAKDQMLTMVDIRMKENVMYNGIDRA